LECLNSDTGKFFAIPPCDPGKWWRKVILRVFSYCQKKWEITFELTGEMFSYYTKFINVGRELPSYKNTQTRSLPVRHADEKITPDKKQFPGLFIRHWLREQIIAGSVYDRLQRERQRVTVLRCLQSKKMTNSGELKWL